MSTRKGILTKDKIGTSKGFKVDRFRSEIRVTAPHKHHNYLEIIYLNAGVGSHVIDDDRFSIDGPVVFVLRRDQVHCWNLAVQASGYVVLIKDEWTTLSPDPEFQHIIRKLQSHACIPLREKDVYLETIFELLYNDPEPITPSAFRRNALLKAVLGRVCELLPKQLPSELPNTRFERFNHLLQSREYADKSVAYFAHCLHTSPQNLNTICRQKSGLSAAEFIASHLVSDAKRMLSYSNMTIAEISAELQFKDHSHFSKFFRKHVGQGPKEYRLNHSF